MKYKISISLVLFLISCIATNLFASFTVPTQTIDMCVPGDVVVQTSPSGGVGPFSYSILSGPMFGQVSSFSTGTGRFEYDLHPTMPGITFDTLKILVTDSLGVTGVGIINFEISKDLMPILVKTVCQNSSYSLVIQNQLPIQGFNLGNYNFLGFRVLFAGALGTFTEGPNFAATGAYTYTAHGATGIDFLSIGITPTYFIDGNVFDGCQVLYDVHNVIVGSPVSQNASYKLCFNESIAPTLPSPTGGTAPFTYSLTGSGPQHAGFFSLNSNGFFIYIPTTGFIGTDSFKYFVIDATGCGSAPSTVTLQVGSIPTTGVINLEQCLNQSVVGTYQASGGIPQYNYFVLEGPSHGTVSPIGPTTSPTFLYRSDTGYVGIDNFTYGITDSAGCGGNPFGTVIIHMNLAALPVSLTACQDNVTQGKFSATGGLGNYALYTVATNPSHGTVTSPCAFACPTFNYSPNPSYVGSDSFTYYVQDFQGCTGTIGTVSITVESVQAFPLSLTGCTNAIITGQLMATGGTGSYMFGIMKPNNNVLFTTAPIVLSQGTITTFDQSTGSFTYQFTVSNPQTENFSFLVIDSVGCISNTAFVQIVPAIPPQVFPFSFSVCEQGSYSGILTATGGNGIYNFTYSNGPNHGTLNPFNPTAGTFTYNLTAGFTGQDSFSYQAISVANGCISNSAIATITVSNVQAPQVQNLTFAGCLDGSVMGNFTASGGSGNYQYMIVSGPISGSLPFVNSSTGEFIYQTAVNFTGIASFTYSATDITTSCIGNIGTVSITVGCT